MRRRSADAALLRRVGQHIRSLRESAKLKQEDVEGFGVSWKHYQKIESGATNTTIKVLYKLAHAFGCHPRELLP